MAETSGSSYASGAFRSLRSPTDEGGRLRFSAEVLAGHAAYRIAKDIKGRPALLINVADPLRSALVGYALENLDVSHGVNCIVVRGDGAQEAASFTLVHCLSEDPAVHELFLRSTQSIVAAIGERPTASEVSRGIAKLVEIFRLAGQAPRKTLQGLWAELLLIAESTSPMDLARSWHVTFSDLYDFNDGGQRIEVKSALGHRRQHYFSLEQLCPPAGTEVLVASVLVARAGHGKTIYELVDAVRGRLGGVPEVSGHIDQVVAAAVGNNWRQAREFRLDCEFALQSLAFYNAAAVPKLEKPLPPQISNVRFQVDLSGVASAAITDLSDTGRLFAAVVPLT